MRRVLCVLVLATMASAVCRADFILPSPADQASAVQTVRFEELAGAREVIFGTGPLAADFLNRGSRIHDFDLLLIAPDSGDAHAFDPDFDSGRMSGFPDSFSPGSDLGPPRPPAPGSPPTPSPGGSHSIPTPGSLCLLSIGGALFLWRQWRGS